MCQILSLQFLQSSVSQQGTIDILGQIIFCWVWRAALCIVGCLAAFWPLCTRCQQQIIPLPTSRQSKVFPNIVKCPLAAKLPLVENHCPGSMRSTEALLIPWFPAVVLSLGKGSSLSFLSFSGILTLPYPNWFSTCVAFKNLLSLINLKLLISSGDFFYFNHTIFNYEKQFKILGIKTYEERKNKTALFTIQIQPLLIFQHIVY